MAAKSRDLYPNAIYHVYSRGNCKKVIFKETEDFEKFLQICNYAYKKYNFKIHSYCLMQNHFHLLLQTPEPNLPQVMHCINLCYALYFNTKYMDIGYVFQGRYQAKPVKTDSYYKTLLSYIHLNPVAAKLFSRVEDWAWSSYHSITGTQQVAKFQDTEYLKKYFEKANFLEQFNTYLYQQKSYLNTGNFSSTESFTLLNDQMKDLILEINLNQDFRSEAFFKLLNTLHNECKFNTMEISKIFGVKYNFMKNKLRSVKKIAQIR